MNQWILISSSLIVCAATWAQGTTENNTSPSANATTNAQAATQSVTKVWAEVTPFAPAQAGPHHQVWQRVLAQTNEAGSVLYRTNSFVELATGKNYLHNGQWLPTQEKIEITAEGAAATSGPHQVTFTPNLNTAGAIHVVTPDGKDLRSHIVGLAYYDFKLEQQVLIAQVQDTVGQLISSNQVLYTNAFTDLNADVLYTYTKAGLEQDVILRERPPLPQAYGLNYDTTRLQVFTEFLNPPVPVIEQKIKRGWKVAKVDRLIGFGSMKIGQGRAFSFGDPSQKLEGIEVEKHWQIREGRTVLVEEVALRSLTPQLRVLPPASAPSTPTAPTNSPNNSTGTNASAGSLLKKYQKPFQLPLVKQAKKSSQPIRVASAALNPTGLVLDYALLADSTNYTFKSDTTYLISSNTTVYLNGTTTFEGGTVIKYDRNSQIDIQGDIQNLTDMYRPAILTAIDDNSVGQSLGTDAPSGAYAAVALSLQGGSYALSNLRILYAQTAIACYYNNYSVSHAQILHCGVGLQTEYGIVTAWNVLMSDVGTCFYGSWYHGSGIHLTCDNGALITDDHDYYESTGDCGTGGPSSSLTMTNSLFTSFAGWGMVSFTANHSWLLGASGIYQTNGAGNFYLAENSSYRGAGTATINPQILYDLSLRTTHPPVVLTNLFTQDTVLSPEVPRDTNNAPDVGYHYAPLDFMSACSVSNAVLTLTNGVAVGYYSFAAILGDSAHLVSQGTPQQHNTLVHYRLVQEQPVNIWPAFTNAASALQNSQPILLSSHLTTNNPSVQMRFSTVDAPNGSLNVFNGGDVNNEVSAFTLRDCEIFAAGSAWNMIYLTNTSALYFNNNLFHRPSSVWVGTVGTITTENNLFFNVGADAAFIYNTGSGASPNTNLNNAFDNCEVFLDGDYRNNAYLNGVVPDMATEASSIITNLVWMSGKLGNYYQATNSPLINQGNTNASLLGFYHYTTQNDQTKETNSLVDIGYHYVALGTNGLPVSTSGDGIGDYLKDSNGNGFYDPLVDLGKWTTNTTCAGGMNDAIRYAQGQNLNVCTTLSDTNGLLNLQVYTPLK